jgi:DNA primase
VALIKQSSIEAVRDAVDMVELVGSRVQLRRVGSRYMARCPFHEERTPSFSVNPELKTYYCFGCQRGGDAIRFVQETEGLDFVGAVEWLADRYRVQLEYDEGGRADERERRRKERLLALLEDVARFCERYLWESPRGEPVREYLAGRGLREEIVREFRLGLSPGGDVVARKASDKGYTQEELLAAGLVNRRGNDYFAGRLLFPLTDARGRVLGFGARRLSENDPIRAKYINTPETELFRKSAVVYGLSLARPALAREDRAIVVEGYTDVLALHQAGVRTAVASMGTALTELQLRELRRLCSRLFLCFDADAAGEEATLRGMELAYRSFDEVRIVPLPPGTDPAEAAEGFERRLGQSESYPRHRVKLAIDRAPSREAAFQRVRDIVGSFDLNTEWLEAMEYAADRLDLPSELQAALAPRGSRATGQISRKALDHRLLLERRVLAGCLAHPALRPLLGELSPDHFQDGEHQALRAAIASGGPIGEQLLPLAAELDALAASEGIDEVTARELVLRLHEQRLRARLAAEGDLGRVKELQHELARIHGALAELTA